VNGRKRERDDEDREGKARPGERADTPREPSARAPEPLDEQSLDEVMRECPL
jgi:hypothetical protein